MDIRTFFQTCSKYYIQAGSGIFPYWSRGRALCKVHRSLLKPQLNSQKCYQEDVSASLPPPQAGIWLAVRNLSHELGRAAYPRGPPSSSWMALALFSSYPFDFLFPVFSRKKYSRCFCLFHFIYTVSIVHFHDPRAYFLISLSRMSSDTF